MLVRQLPAESATATVLRLRVREDAERGEAQPPAPHDPETEQWSRAEQLIASVRDELHILRWLYTSYHADRAHRPKWKPDPLPRPGMSPVRKRKALQPEQQSLLAQYLAGSHGSDITHN